MIPEKTRQELLLELLKSKHHVDWKEWSQQKNASHELDSDIITMTLKRIKFNTAQIDYAMDRLKRNSIL